MLSFNFTHLDIDHSRGFGIVTTRANWVREAVKTVSRRLHADQVRAEDRDVCREPGELSEVLATFLKRAKKELLIYDPKISDKEMLRMLQERAKAGVEIKVIGSVAGSAPVRSAEADRMRLHTRTIIRDRRQAFVGSQSFARRSWTRAASSA